MLFSVHMDRQLAYYYYYFKKMYTRYKQKKNMTTNKMSQLKTRQVKQLVARLAIFSPWVTVIRYA